MNSILKKKNIIFDLHGVLFELQQGEGAQHKLFSPLPEGIALLQEVAAQDGYQLYGCTNWGDAYIEILKREHPEFTGYFQGIVTPNSALAKKPDPRILQYLLDAYQLESHSSVFIDDQMANVESARTLGIEAIHMIDAAYVRSELLRLGVLSKLE